MKVICHMTTSLDGKVTGDFFDDPVSYEACNHYYRIHREFEADAFACGRITMETSFTEERKIDVSEFDEVNNLDDFVCDSNASFYAVSFDRKARVGWLESRIQDEDPGWGLQKHLLQ